MRYRIYLRFPVFDKIESSHFNCSLLGVLLQALGNGSSVCSPSLSSGHYVPLCKMAIMILLYPCHLILDHLGSHMVQRNSSVPCYYIRLSPLLLVMRTGSQSRNNLSEDCWLIQGLVAF